MSLKCAIELGIPDMIHKHGKPMTLSELADALPINEAKSDGLHRVMRILVHSKFFVKISEDGDKEEAYCLTRASRLLLRDGPMSAIPMALLVLDPITIAPLNHMCRWFQNDDFTPFVKAHGKAFWEQAGADQRYMHVVDGLEGFKNLSFVGGDMFESIPHADAVFLKWILHMFNDEDCVKLLKSCKEAISWSKTSGGKVIVVDIVVEDEKDERTATETKLCYDMEIMAQVGGKKRTEKEWAKIFSDAGFGNYKITPALGLRSIIEVFP